MRELIGARLRAERERLGYNQIEFAAIGGASNRTQVEWERGKQVPNAEFLALAAAAGVDVQYVLTGNRSSSAMTSDEEELLAGYRGLDIRSKAGVLGMVETLGASPSSSAREKQSQLANTTAAAGKITGKKSQVVQGNNMTGKTTIQLGRKKKDAL